MTFDERGLSTRKGNRRQGKSQMKKSKKAKNRTKIIGGK